MDSPLLFPLWLWLLLAVWVISLLIWQRLPTRHDWQLVLGVSVAVYTVLLVGAVCGRELTAFVPVRWAFWGCGTVILASGLLLVRLEDGRGQRLAMLAATIALAVIAGLWNAAEVALVWVLLGAALVFGVASNWLHPADPVRMAVAARDRWVIGVFAVFVGVVWLGAVLETQRADLPRLRVQATPALAISLWTEHRTATVLLVVLGIWSLIGSRPSITATGLAVTTEREDGP